MDIVVYSQTYRARTAERQLEIDDCMRFSCVSRGQC
jgi:hypothetical protein